jgi:hypothetical protein
MHTPPGKLLAEGKPTDLMRKFRQDSLENVFLRLCETRADPESGFDSANPAAAPRDPLVCSRFYTPIPLYSVNHVFACVSCFVTAVSISVLTRSTILILSARPLSLYLLSVVCLPDLFRSRAYQFTLFSPNLSVCVFTFAPIHTYTHTQVVRSLSALSHIGSAAAMGSTAASDAGGSSRAPSSSQPLMKGHYSEVRCVYWTSKHLAVLILVMAYRNLAQHFPFS